ncbi:MAG TPA: thioesterase family protein [Xanthobacteraceae bacterium]
MANFVHRRQLVIEWGYCDPAGIVFNARFFEIFDAGTWALFEAALGVPRHELSAVFDIVGVPLVDARARFIAPVKFGDLLEHETQVSEFRRSSFDVAHRLTVGGELAAEGRETRVWAAQDKDDPARIRSKPVPGEIVARFRRT